MTGTSSAIDSPVIVHPSLFHSRLNIFTFPQILSSIAFFFSRTDSPDSPGCLSILFSISIFIFSFLFFHFFYFLAPSGRLSRLSSAFKRTLNEFIVSYRIPNTVDKQLDLHEHLLEHRPIETKNIKTLIENKK